MQLERLDPRVRVVWIVAALAPAAMTAGIGLVATVFGLGSPLGVSPVVLFGAVAVGIVLLGGTFAVVRYRVWGYELREDSLYLVRGVLTRRDTSVPFVRVQHVDTRRSPVERLVGLASVVVYTAGTRGADITVPGLTPEQAEQLREQLRELAADSEYDAV